MSTAPVNIPADFYFQLENLARRFDNLPGKLNAPGTMCDMGPEYRLVSSSDLGGTPDWLDVRCAWSPSGIAFVFDYKGPKKVIPGLVKLNLWIDTRNTRNVHRATRFCHQFRLEFDPTIVIARKRGPKESMAPGAEPSQIRINRALADAPVADRDSIFTDLSTNELGGFRLAIFFTSEALNGFDVEVNRMLGLAYRIQAPGRDWQRLGPGLEFPVAEDPSLWTVLELVD
jgi:hypothetical protein